MGTLSVSTSDLEALSSRLRAGAAEASALRPSSFAALGALAGLPEFLEAWGAALTLVADDAGRLADAVAAVSRLYSDVEWANTRAAS